MNNVVLRERVLSLSIIFIIINFNERGHKTQSSPHRAQQFIIITDVNFDAVNARFVNSHRVVIRECLCVLFVLCIIYTFVLQIATVWQN